MSSISSISSYIPPLASSKVPDDYEINVGLYGPAVATVIGAADAAADSVSAICSFSTESLDKLGDMVGAGYDAVGTALSDTGDAVGAAIGSATGGFTQLYADVAAMADKGIEAVSDAAEEVVDSLEDSLSNAASTVSDAASSVVDGISDAASSVADLVSLGVTAGTLS